MSSHCATRLLGSYGGTLTTLLRATYPAAVIGGSDDWTTASCKRVRPADCALECNQWYTFEVILTLLKGLAASAPIGYYDPLHWSAHAVDEYTWSDIVNRVYREVRHSTALAPGVINRRILGRSNRSCVRKFMFCFRNRTPLAL